MLTAFYMTMVSAYVAVSHALPQAVKIIASDITAQGSPALLEALDQRYVTSIVPGVKNQVQTCDTLEKLSPERESPITLLILNIHGSPVWMNFGPNQDQQIKLSAYFSEDEAVPATQDLSCLDRLLDPNAIIILESCSTSLDGFNHFEFGKYEIPMNMHRFIASLVPGRTVFAPDFDVLKDSLEIQFKPSFTVWARGFSMQKEVVDLCGSITKTGIKAEECRLKKWTELKEKAENQRLFHRLGNESIPIMPFKVISPQEAKICQDPLIYFSMKKYCDKAKQKPSQKKIKAYREKDFSSYQALNFVEKLDKKRNQRVS